MDDINSGKFLDICKKENIYCSQENISKIIDICPGDLRKAVNFLQKCKKNKYYFSEKIGLHKF